MATTAPLAPLRSSIAQEETKDEIPTESSRQSITEKQNSEILKWNNTYHTYYERDWTNETTQYLSDKIDQNETITNYKWYQYQSNETSDIPSLTGNSLSDIGNDAMITIGDKRKCDNIDVYLISKHFNAYKKLYSNGPSPCCRFHHSAEYIPMLNAILFFGGFDSQCNFNDARLLVLDSMIWYDLNYAQKIGFRAHHSCAVRLVKNDNGNKFEGYIFGGMWCDGGPYKYHNDIFRFTFFDQNIEESKDEKLGYFQCEKLKIKGKKPEKRSMSQAWIKGNMFYVFGGSKATSTFNDLWVLDLNTNVWSEIEYKGILGAPKTYKIKPKKFRFGAKLKPCYFDQDRNELIVIHYGALTGVQKQFIAYNGTFKAFQKNIIEKKESDAKDTKDKEVTARKGVIGMLQDTIKCTIFVFDMYERVWYIRKSRNIGLEDKMNVPSSLVGKTRVIRIGEYLVQMGGGGRSRNFTSMKKLYLLKLPTNMWNKERLIWIGHCKENDKGKSDASVFNKCAKDVICLILQFLR